MKISVALFFVFLSLTLSGQNYGRKDYVPNAITAVKIAEAVLVPVFGEEQIERERPFTAKLEDGVWTVSGTLQCSDGKGGTGTLCPGGVAVVRISKADARIISMVHYK